ncbi:hypothetical protein ASE07_09840 [Noviherbaspirillum sp. Root189]|nr:hypothetical protein ASE07_09840 [Noviherbaspirillum sp. Root189]
MGERIIHGLNEGKFVGNKLMAPAQDGYFPVVSNAETTRAISWYLQAKAVMDNARPDKEPTLLSKGSMLMKDPDGRLNNFLLSSRNSYGRISTHFNERSLAEKANFKNVGIAGGLVGLSKESYAHHGIEDMSDRMPSGKGTVIFDALKGKDGSQQLFLKWETAGMPTVFGKSVHADTEEGVRTALKNHVKAFQRCAAHSFNFIGHMAGTKKDVNWGIHREDVHKGDAKPLFVQYAQIMKTLDKSCEMSAPEDRGKDKRGFGVAAVKLGKTHGLYQMEDMLKGARGMHVNRANDEQYAPDKREVHEAEIKKIDQLLFAMKEFSAAQGNNLGLERRGAEVHINLDTNYVNIAAPAYVTAPSSSQYSQGEALPDDDSATARQDQPHGWNTYESKNGAPQIGGGPPSVSRF